jgi:hypothetical protein
MKSRGCIVPQANSLKTFNGDGDLMESRICEHCGQQFFTPTKSEKEDDKFFPLGLTVFSLLAFYFFEEGGWCWLGVAFCVLIVLSAIIHKSDRNKAKKGKLVAPDRNCPSCDDSSADIDSPLGRQLILKWSDPSKMDPEFIDALSSIVSSVGDAGSSPRKQLIANQPSLPSIDPQRTSVATSIIPIVGDEAGEVVVDR